MTWVMTSPHKTFSRHSGRGNSKKNDRQSSVCFYINVYGCFITVDWKVTEASKHNFKAIKILVQVNSLLYWLLCFSMRFLLKVNSNNKLKERTSVKKTNSLWPLNILKISRSLPIVNTFWEVSVDMNRYIYWF